MLLQILYYVIYVEFRFKTRVFAQFPHRFLKLFLPLVVALRFFLIFPFLFLFFLLALLSLLVVFCQSGRFMEADQDKTDNRHKYIFGHVRRNVVLKLLLFYVYQIVELL